MSEVSETVAGPPPNHELFDTQAGFDEAVDRLLAQTGRELRIFDPDLVALRLNAPARVAQLERFLGVNRTRRLYIALHDPEPVMKFCPRMLDLLKRYTHAVQVQRTQEEIRELRDAFLVLDTVHFVRRPEAGSRRGVIAIGDRVEAYAMRSRFEEIWAASYPAVSPTTLGL